MLMAWALQALGVSTTTLPSEVHGFVHEGGTPGGQRTPHVRLFKFTGTGTMPHTACMHPGPSNVMVLLLCSSCVCVVTVLPVGVGVGVEGDALGACAVCGCMPVSSAPWISVHLHCCE